TIQNGENMNGANGGNGAWNDYPYFGSEKFWFIEDCTIKGSGGVNTSGIIDAKNGGRYVVRHTYMLDTNPGGHGNEGNSPRGMRAKMVYHSQIEATIALTPHTRSGTSMQHDVTYMGFEPVVSVYTAQALFDYRTEGGGTLGGYGVGDGANPWD